MSCGDKIRKDTTGAKAPWRDEMKTQPTVLGVIGGTGLAMIEGMTILESRYYKSPYYEVLDEGPPGVHVVVGEMAGKNIIFVNRHGEDHTDPPSLIQSRAHFHVLDMLHATHTLSVNAVGSLQEAIEECRIVLPTHFINRTSNRQKTFFWRRGLAGHVSTATPVDPEFRIALIRAGQRALGMEDKTLFWRHTTPSAHICIDGPQFSTKAESLLYKNMNGGILEVSDIKVDVVGMNWAQEACLAAELGFIHGHMALVTDLDAWKDGEHVDNARVVRNMTQNASNATKIIAELVRGHLPDEVPDRSSRMHLRGAILTNPDSRFYPTIREELEWLIGPELERMRAERGSPTADNSNGQAVLPLGIPG